MFNAQCQLVSHSTTGKELDSGPVPYCAKVRKQGLKGLLLWGKAKHFRAGLREEVFHTTR